MAHAVAVSGVGETEYSRSSGRSALMLQLEASLSAIEDAGLTPKDIDGIIPLSAGTSIAEDFIANFGIPDLRFSAIIPMGGASTVAALQCAAAAISFGICKHVLLPAGRNGYSGARMAARITDQPHRRLIAEFETPIGAITAAQLYAPMARRHMEMFGTTSRQFAEIAVATRAHALLNERAMMKKEITVEDHQSSRLIADPFRLLDCCLESDGGAAIVVSAADRAKDLRKHPILVTGIAEGHPDSPSTITQRTDITTLGVAKAAVRAFAMAGITHDEIDVAQIYDCFTYIVLCQLEDLGFCKKGEGGPFVESGAIRLGGKLPVNTHGGLLSQAHIGGMNHVIELVRQLRREAGAAQVKDAATGLVTGFGDLGDGAVAIMQRA
ncbi:thiolase C-terminal domain-containing protein [Ottowia thiooxydans]|uniref:thiolase C-terminal domain-containing protein n=1 Tax=Ottowia thiooxydans TaxID=219182 RepID=UPI00048C710B|nr:hypothetical protein [Ottowia thiooxydans]